MDVSGFIFIMIDLNSIQEQAGTILCTNKDKSQIENYMKVAKERMPQIFCEVAKYQVPRECFDRHIRYHLKM